MRITAPTDNDKTLFWYKQWYKDWPVGELIKELKIIASYDLVKKAYAFALAGAGTEHLGLNRASLRAAAIARVLYNKRVK